jgi:hypothetical protein
VYGLDVETEDFSTKISLPTGQKGTCQEVGKGYLRGWLRGIWLMVRGSWLMGESPKLKAESPKFMADGS